MEKKYLLPADFCHKYCYRTAKGEMKFKLKDIKFFAEIYCNVDLTLVEKWVVEHKMIDLYKEVNINYFTGIAVYVYTEKPKCVSLFNKFGSDGIG